MTAEEWKPIRGPFARWPRISDAILALVSFALTIPLWTDAETSRGDFQSLITFIVIIIGNGALYWRRRHPVRVHWIILGASAMAMLINGLYGPIFGLAISLYNIGRYAKDYQKSVTGLGAAYVLLIIGEIAHQGLSHTDIPELILPFIFWFLGRQLQARGEYLRVLKERAEQLEREQLVEAERAVAAERTRIAREMHDIVAHQVSLMTVQAGAAKTVAESDPVAAASAMGAVEEAGRQALDELRHVLGVLRQDNERNGSRPQPGRSDLPRLMEEIRRAGLGVELVHEGSHRHLPARIELAIFRIVQEALTNVLKHGGPNAKAQVMVRADDRVVTVEIKDNGIGITRLPGSGHGIAGMRERAQTLGGTLDAGPRASGGFSVVARIPVWEETA